MILREYQERALDELWAWFLRHDGGNPIVEACVGAGKSLMIAAMAKRADAEFPGTRVLVLVHQKELLQQNVDKLRRIWPAANAGVYSASVGRRQLGAQITYATIGSVYKIAHELGRVDIVLADECHLINTKQEGIWRKFIGDLQRYNPACRVVGWTGTPFRGNGVWLTAGDTPLFQGVSTRVTMRELLDLGFLSPLVPAPTATRVQADGIRTSGDDYVISELARATDREDLVRETCADIVQLAAGRRRWLVFAVTVEHAHHVSDELCRLGVESAVVSATTPAAERDLLIAQFRSGRIKCLVNVAVLTTGFDVPEVDFIALLRATKSPVLYVQIAGRGMRIADGKTDCLWADYTDTTERLGPVDAITGRAPTGGRKGEAPVKLCDTCGSQNPTAALFCVDCGAPFPEPERVNHDRKASSAAVLSQQLPMVKTIEVTDVVYRPHRKEGSPPSLRVDYMVGMVPAAKEWVCLSHAGFARMKAERWWQTRALIDAIPGSTEQALEWLQFDSNILRRPAKVNVTMGKKYPEVIGYEW